MPERHLLCRLEEIGDPGSRGFCLDLPDERLELLLVRLQQRLYAYRNRCPHTGVNLEWRRDQFLDLSGRYIQCATHGALFRPGDGFCLRGPCAGESLQPLPLAVEQGRVYLLRS